MLVIGCGVLLSGAAEVEAQRVDVRGCYDLEIGRATSGRAPARSLQFAPPPRIELDSAPALNTLSPSPAYAMRPAPGAMPSVHRFSDWRPLDDDSILMVWSTGFVGTVLRLEVRRDTLSGFTASFTDVSPLSNWNEGRAIRVPCDSLLAPEDRANYRIGRGIELATGDSIRLGEPLPTSVPVTETEVDGRYRIVPAVAGPHAGAESVTVSVRNGIVFGIGLSYASDTDFDALVERLRSAHGEPSRTAMSGWPEAGRTERAAWSTPMVEVYASRSMRTDGRASVTVRITDPRAGN